MTYMEVYSSYIEGLHLQALINVIGGMYQQSGYTLQTFRLFLGCSIDEIEGFLFKLILMTITFTDRIVIYVILLQGKERFQILGKSFGYNLWNSTHIQTENDFL